jgi:hypothetical protein
MEERACGKCDFFHLKPDEESDADGECRRNPPIMFQYRPGAITTSFPHVSRYDFCGEYILKGKEKRSCLSCLFFDAYEEHDLLEGEDEDISGLCRKNPPTTFLWIPDRIQSGEQFLVGKEAYHYDWPSAGSSWWCGEWKKHENPPKFRKTKVKEGEIKLTKLSSKPVEKKK